MGDKPNSPSRGEVPGVEALPEAAGPDAAWADALIASAADWEATTPQPVATSPADWALCREARPASVYGPHGRHAYWVRVDPDGAAAFTASETMPVGSTIIKEKHYHAESARTHDTPVALGVMVKREPGYDPDHGDWEYAYITLNTQGGPAEVTRGRIATCIDCHANRAEHDYLFRVYGHESQP